MRTQVDYVGEFELSEREEPEPLAALSAAALASRRFESGMVDVGSETSSSNLSDLGLGVAQWSIPPEELVTEGDCIGRGSIGEVFLGSWKGMRVAIKRIYRKDYPPAMLLALSAEVSILFQLRHPNLLLFLGASIGPDTFCIVSEFMDRGALRTMLLDPHQRCVQPPAPSSFVSYSSLSSHARTHTAGPIWTRVCAWRRTWRWRSATYTRSTRRSYTATSSRPTSWSTRACKSRCGVPPPSHTPPPLGPTLTPY
jgi:hypothetical protein